MASDGVTLIISLVVQTAKYKANASARRETTAAPWNEWPPAECSCQLAPEREICHRAQISLERCSGRTATQPPWDNGGFIRVSFPQASSRRTPTDRFPIRKSWSCWVQVQQMWSGHWWRSGFRETWLRQ
jgi:hypothetical protein